MYRQYQLRSGPTATVTWLDSKTDLRIGQRLTLKHSPERLWTITGISSMMLEHPPRKDWKVGGLT